VECILQRAKEGAKMCLERTKKLWRGQNKGSLILMGFEEMVEMDGTYVVNRWGLSLRIVGTAKVVIIAEIGV
jgi:hypothetical protein